MGRIGMTLQEFVETKERATAWVFRILITLIGAAGTAAIYLAWGTLIDVKTKSETGIQLQWTAIGKINDAQQQAITNLNVLTTKLDDHIKAETQIDSDLKDITKDHEQRLRHIELPHG
jgi:hypothetical protein